MNKDIINQQVLKKNKFKNSLLSFIGGGLVGVGSQFFYELFLNYFQENDSVTLTIMLVIFTTALATGLGFYDKLGQIFGAGLFVPISGFSNALTSSALESKSEGLIFGIGSNMFKLAGSVITYGIVAAIILNLFRYLL